MRKKVISFALFALLFAFCVPAEAQQPTKVYRLGFFAPRSAPEPRDEVFRQALRDLGYVEGKNIIIEYRYEGKLDRLRAVAQELVRLKVDVIVAPGTASAQAAKTTTKTIPIVFFAVPDPVSVGLVASLARPGGNVTGATPISAELSGKRLELLKEVVPMVSRIAVLSSPGSLAKTETLNEMEAAARMLGVQLQILEVRGADDFDSAFRAIRSERAGAFTVVPTPMFITQRRRIIDLVTKNKLPAIFHWSDFVEAGGLMSYGADYAFLARRGAYYVDRILKGAKPADLPVEQPKKFEFIINLKAAKQIGLTIPPNVLARADKVIR